MSKIKTGKSLNSGCRPPLRRPALPVALMLSILFLSACASQATAPEDSEDAIIERAQNRWDTLLAGDFESAYAYYSPGYRSTTSLIDFAIGIRTRRVRWTSAEYKEHSCTENTCTINFEVGFMVNRPVPGMEKYESSSVLEDQWVKTGGQWWYLPKKK